MKNKRYLFAIDDKIAWYYSFGDSCDLEELTQNGWGTMFGSKNLKHETDEIFKQYHQQTKIPLIDLRVAKD